MLRQTEHGDAEAQKGQTDEIDDEISKHAAPPEIFQKNANNPLKHFLMRVTGALTWLIQRARTCVVRGIGISAFSAVSPCAVMR